MDGRSRWPDERIDELAREVERQGDVRFELRGLRGDVRELRDEFGELRGEFGELRGEFREMRGEFREMRGEFGQLRGEFGQLRLEVHEGRRWLIGLVVTVFVGLLAIVVQLGLHG